MADDDINLRIEVVDRSGSGGNRPAGGSAGNPSSPGGGSSGITQPTPQSATGQGSRGVSRASNDELREQWSDSRSGEQASLSETVLKSFGLTRGIGSALQKHREARNKQAFGEWREKYRAYEKERDEYVSSQSAEVPAAPQPPEFRPGGQHFIPSGPQPEAGAAPPLPGGGPSTPPVNVPGGGPATFHAPPNPGGPGGGGPPIPGSPGGPPAAPTPPGPSGGGMFPGGGGGAAMAGLVAAAGVQAVQASLQIIGTLADKIVEGITRVMQEYSSSVNMTAPFSAPVLESLVDQQLQKLEDIRYRAENAGDEIAAVNDEMTTFNTEVNRAWTILLEQLGPATVESLQTITLMLAGFNELSRRQEFVLETIANYVPYLKSVDQRLKTWNDQNRKYERKRLEEDLFRPKGSEPEGPAADRPMLPLFPGGFPLAPSS